MEQVLNRFCLDGSPVSCERYGEGHINLTFLVVTRCREERGSPFRAERNSVTAVILRMRPGISEKAALLSRCRI